jgi:hypothetical protein
MIDVETERRNRIRLSIFAYAYEFHSDSLISDGEFDEMCTKINPSIETGHAVMDQFFREKFDPNTGMWIHNHPELAGIAELYNRFYKKGGKRRG